MKKITCVAAVLLAGCVMSRLNTGLQGLLGADIHEAAARMGYPNSEREMLGDKIYVWSTDSSAVIPLPMTTTTTGYVGTTPVGMTTNSMGFMPAHFHCTVQLAVTPEGKIKSYQYYGNPGGCGPYARMLNRGR